MNESDFEAWSVSEDKFPREGSNVDKLRFLLKYAILAPSSHNTQPWIFKIVNNNSIEVYADRTRALPVVDPEDRELTISCGAALCYLQIALQHFGYRHNVELLPKSEDEDLLARVSIDDTNNRSLNRASKEDSSVFQAIIKRRTNRLKFEDREVASSLLSKLQSVVAESGGGDAWFHIAKEGDQKNLLAHLIAEGDRIQMSDKRFRRELASWIHSNRSHNKDGMPGYSFGFNDIISLMSPFVLRTFDSGKGQAAKDRQLASGSPVLVVLGTNSDEPIDWLKIGLALGHMLLTTQSENVWSSFLDQPLEVPELRWRVKDAIKRKEGFPQLLLRMGYGQQVKPTPRRPVEEVVR
jgi:nitroreductase